MYFLEFVFQKMLIFAHFVVITLKHKAEDSGVNLDN